jgi:hypothetical protein
MRKFTNLVFLLLFTHSSFSQKTDSTNNIYNFSGSAGITNNGISLIPTFSLNRPAGIILLSMGRRKFSFEPDLRFSLSGKPWSFIFWFRYQAIKTNKFSLRLGAHPAINFRTEYIPVNNEIREQLIARRYLAAEIVPNYYLKKNISIGIYYLYGRGFDKGGVRYSHFITLNSNFSHIKLSDQLHMTFSPQIFYLRLVKDEGFFGTATIGLLKKNSPFSLSAIFNKELKKGIPGARDFIWNATLTYSFGKNYVPK